MEKDNFIGIQSVVDFFADRYRKRKNIKIKAEKFSVEARAFQAMEQIKFEKMLALSKGERPEINFSKIPDCRVNTGNDEPVEYDLIGMTVYKGIIQSANHWMSVVMSNE
jgi:hypothetical protein